MMNRVGGNVVDSSVSASMVERVFLDVIAVLLLLIYIVCEYSSAAMVPFPLTFSNR